MSGGKGGNSVVFFFFSFLLFGNLTQLPCRQTLIKKDFRITNFLHSIVMHIHYYDTEEDSLRDPSNHLT